MSNRKHILIIPEWYPNDNDPQLGVFIQKQVKAVAEHCRITVVFCQSAVEEKPTRVIEENNVKIIRLFFKKSVWPLRNYRNYLKAFKQVATEIPDIDCVHLHVLGKNYLAYKKIFSSYPFIISEHWSGYLHRKKNRLGERLSREAFHSAKAVIAVSQHLKKALAKRYELNAIHVIPNVIELSTKKQESDSAKTILISVADLVDEIKNISSVISVLMKMSFEKPIRYHIVGDGKDKNELEVLAATNKNPNLEIQFLGRLNNSDTLAEISKSDFLILNSRFETFGMVCAEAILSGKPVIATRCGGPEEFVNESNGILIAIDNNEELTSAIEKMLVTYQNYNSFEMNKAMDEQYSAKQIGKLIAEIYESIK